MRSHLFPFRTQKLSSYTPKILRWRRLGKIGLCRHFRISIFLRSSVGSSTWLLIRVSLVRVQPGEPPKTNPNTYTGCSDLIFYPGKLVFGKITPPIGWADSTPQDMIWPLTIRWRDTPEWSGGAYKQIWFMHIAQITPTSFVWNIKNTLFYEFCWKIVKYMV